MREIKFRAWAGGVMVYFDLFNIRKTEQGHFMRTESPHLSVSQECNIMQYTGLKDKNGVEIYEGDILAYDEFEINEQSYKGVVKYQVEIDYPAFDIDPYIDCDSNGFSYIKACCQCEVIGNIYENAELLEN